MTRDGKCFLQLHLRSGTSLCADGTRGSEKPSSAGGLDRRRWYFLPWGVHLQHVCHEPCTLQTLPKGQKSGPLGSPTPGHLHISRGQDRCSALHVWLQSETWSEELDENHMSEVCILCFRAITLWRKGQRFLGLEQIMSSWWRWMKGRVDFYHVEVGKQCV